MTPKEKCDELVEKFLNYSKSEKPPKPNGFWSAKQCAIICCDEIIEDSELTKINIDDNDVVIINSAIKFWQQVKQELNNL